MSKLTLLNNEFHITREEAKALYKAWQMTPDDGKLMNAYSVAWQRHQQVFMELFLEECKEEFK